MTVVVPMQKIIMTVMEIALLKSTVLVNAADQRLKIYAVNVMVTALKNAGTAQWNVILLTALISLVKPLK